MLEFLNKNFPDVAKALNKSDDFAEAAKQLSKADNLKLTRKQAEAITEAFENAGLSEYLPKTSNSLELTGDTLNITADVWKRVPCDRGNYIDEFMNEHSLGNSITPSKKKELSAALVTVPEKESSKSKNNSKEVCEGVTTVVGTAAALYVTYRIIRLIPSCTPVTWWTLPANIAAP